ncbi:hypothetical protein TEA_016587 [Camellia sinensis var. sinensis]|uniref:C2 domain-containing protein n=1 Tax=Camellia sinensis var. sinensis TaxID=542762 RepID=A0A4S4E178_CAMSN|nr:hypothetical protein TEA_016587 [Camellia sinensis var. sinensis]
MGTPPQGFGYPTPPSGYGYLPPGHGYLLSGYGYPPPQPGYVMQVQQQPELPKKNKLGWFEKFLGRLCAVVVIDVVINNNTQFPDDCRRHSWPTWNIPISFKVEEETAANQILVVDLRCCAPTGSGGDKDIGEVLVQVKDLMGSIEDNSLTYQIRTPFGNPKAKLTFIPSDGHTTTGFRIPDTSIRLRIPATGSRVPAARLRVSTSSTWIRGASSTMA